MYPKYTNLATSDISISWCFGSNKNIAYLLLVNIPYSKDHVANMGPTWVLSFGPRLAPGTPMNLATRDAIMGSLLQTKNNEVETKWPKFYRRHFIKAGDMCSVIIIVYLVSIAS